jgi:hypothetical protein
MILTMYLMGFSGKKKPSIILENVIKKEFECVESSKSKKTINHVYSLTPI